PAVAARISATARLRRLASTGAAWLTESRIRCSSAWSYGVARLSRTEPITSPPTVSGTHEEAPGTDAHTGQESRGRRPPFSEWVRPDRTARHDRGSAPRRVPASGEPSGSGVTASSRSALVFRVSTTAVVAARV